MVSYGDGLLYAFSYQPGIEGQQLEFPVGSGCLPTPASCNMDLTAHNTNMEDVAYVPVAGGEFFAINQDADAVERWSAATGAFIDQFPIGGSVPGGPKGAVPKGLAYIPDSPALPSAIRRPGGVVLVCFDSSFPALQAFSVDGEVLATELLTIDGTPSGATILNVDGCPDGLQLESLAGDPKTGRLFLSNQGSLAECDYLYVLTPAGGRCPADFNADGAVNSQDFFDFLTAFFAQTPAADFNTDGAINSQDFFDFLNAFFAPC